MLSFSEWRVFDTKIKKKKEKKDEQRVNQTHGEGGNFDQQRKAIGGDSQVTQQTIHVFTVPEL
jgi:hypothetical protein